MDNTLIINTLADGEWHSGVEMAELLGVSRAAVWKRLQKLQSIGLDIQREQSRGYRLPYRFTPLDAERLEALPYDVLLKPITDSTNTDIQSYLKASDKQWPDNYVICTAEQQTAGRGRRGREWVSPYGANLYLSCGATLPVGASSLETLSLSVGLILARQLSDAGISDVAVKWPNDVYIQGRKVAGILIEVDGDLSAECNLVIGIGVNFVLKSIDTGAITQPFTAVSDYTGLRRDELLESLAKEIKICLGDIVEGREDSNLCHWTEYDYLRDKPITVHLGQQEVRGVGRGIDRRGNLKLEMENGDLRLFAGGEVSVRVQ